MSILDTKKIHKSFIEFFDRKDIRSEIEKIENYLYGPKCSSNFYPNEKDVLRFATIDLSKVKCIILGMDPYPSDYISSESGEVTPVATGRSFEVRSLKSWLDPFKQSSLQNILKSIYYLEKGKVEELSLIRDEIKNGKFKILAPSLLWDSLESQGVLWLNAVLTVDVHKSGSHIKIWKYFGDELIKYTVSKNQNIIWLIWGDVALKRVEDLVPKDRIIYTCHPASRVNNNFIEACPFKNIKNVKWTGV